MGFQQVKSITVRYEDGSLADGKFILGEDEQQYTLAPEVNEMSLNSTGEDYFEALSKIREELAAFKAVPVCYGASRNVFPSRHSRRFERGLKAYKMSKGNTAKLAIWCIFSTPAKMSIQLRQTNNGFISVSGLQASNNRECR